MSFLRFAALRYDELFKKHQKLTSDSDVQLLDFESTGALYSTVRIKYYFLFYFLVLNL